LVAPGIFEGGMMTTDATMPGALGLRLMVIVSTDPSDLFFANQISHRFKVAGIVLEHQRDPLDMRPRWQKALSLLNRPGELIARAREWFSRVWKVNVERRLYQELPVDFGEDGKRLDGAVDCPVLRIEGTGKLNDHESVDWIRARSPDLIVVCGAALLRQPILSLPRFGVLNLHGGLSQFYRGLFTTDWAIYNREPEYVGATVHFVSEGIDDGGVVFQGRPHLSVGDHPNRCYEKVVRLGVEMMSAAIIAIDRGELHEPQVPSKGRLYRHQDFTAAVKRRLWRRWRRTMVEYDRQRESRNHIVNTALIHPFEPEATPGASSAKTITTEA
jgi:folate-dependent phosphoribosylglycinamide formyltransferase PurN